MPTAMSPAASARLVSCADYDSGWIGVTNHEGFRLELEHKLRGRPSQAFVVFSPNFEDSYSLLAADSSHDPARAVGVESDDGLITLWADRGETLQRVWDPLESNEENRNYGFIRVLALR